ncbi:putative atpase synthesis protein 25 [Erysiphe necator]|uniref:ATPase synthesis protein 25 n=1 Tax=Uncinula necator TaxID=52586 RepID=A0A0B1NW57_UNCNE|nr:putative atpase synthesis protein 25 [Erysiphe necator]
MIFSRILIEVGSVNCKVFARSFVKNFSYTTRLPICRSKKSVIRCSTLIRRSHVTSIFSSHNAHQSQRLQEDDCTEENESQKIELHLHSNNDNINNLSVEKQVEEEVPWYLREESSQTLAQPFPERQRIPDLPELSPLILEPLMKHISINLGLDYLSLLDLRELNPPPALGANLLMLLATARSERHLHVSADRLCRWLRSEFKLRPDADGLLGRNELKKRVKRKANKAKLIGKHLESIDDGIRSDWICVNVGTVNDLESLTQEEKGPRSFTGFGQRTKGVKIVVQLLTAEKREVIGLEKLWNEVLKKGSPLEEPEQIDKDGLSICKAYF